MRVKICLWTSMAGRSLRKQFYGTYTKATCRNLVKFSCRRQNAPTFVGAFYFKRSVLAATYSRLATTIGAEGLNCRVRNENGCFPFAKPPTHNFQTKDLFAENRRATQEIRKQSTLFQSVSIATLTIPFESSVGVLVRLGSTNCFAST